MKKIFFLFFITFTIACSTYYQTPNGKMYFPNVNDTLIYTWKITTDTNWYIIKQMQYWENDTLVSVSFFPDSTFFNYHYYALNDRGMFLLSEFYAFDMSLMFWKINKAMAFGIDNNKVGKIELDKDLEAGNFVQKIKIKSIGSQLDTLIIADSVLNLLRVDVKMKVKQKNPKMRDHSKMSYYFYPGLGLFYVKGKNNYTEQILFIEKK